MIKSKLLNAFTLIIILSLTGCFSGQSNAAQGGGQPAESLPVAPAVPAESLPEEPPGAPEPDNDWQRDLPENHSMDSGVLAALHAALDDAPIYAAVTVKDGYIVDEYFKEGYDGNSVFSLQSCTKSFTGALVGVAIDQGYIESVDVPLAQYFPELQERDNPYWGEITIRHLLTHSSGINDANFMDWYRSENWIDYTLNQGIAGKPGTVFIYSTGGSHLLSAVIQQAVGMSEYEYGRRNLFEPLGMDSVRWRTDPQGFTDGGNGIEMNVYDMAKFGQLFLGGGQWRGRQIISGDSTWSRFSPATSRTTQAGRSPISPITYWRLVNKPV
ncbi:MAG: beta-lactamase family protein [Gracilibacteraceae bacterium]|nr:beta-lactamase family protein [Gracilibacteraceae bacterium]